MPELPEVETIVNANSPRLTGWRMISAEFLSPLCCGIAMNPILKNSFFNRYTRLSVGASSFCFT